MTYFERLHPWCIVRLLPHCQVVTVARFRSRNAALDYQRVLRQLIPQGRFEVMFDAVSLTCDRPNTVAHNPHCWGSRKGH